MPSLNNEAKCITCKNNLRVVQKGNVEAGEKWVCNAYPVGSPLKVTFEAGPCKFYIPEK